MLLAMSATNTVAAQNTMAITESIVINSSISHLLRNFFSALFLLQLMCFAFGERVFQFHETASDQSNQYGSSDKDQCNNGHCEQKLQHFKNPLGIKPLISSLELVKNITSSLLRVKHFFEKNCTKKYLPE